MSYERLFMRYYPRFRVFVLRFIREEATTEDILQNIFLKLWINRHSLQEDLSVTAYIFVLAKNEIYNYLRYKRTHITAPYEEQLFSGTLSVPGVDREYDYTELEANLQAAIDELPTKRREIFRLNRYEFKSAKEIAEMLGLSVRTVEKQIELSLKHIRNKLGPTLMMLLPLINLIISL